MRCFLRISAFSCALLLLTTSCSRNRDDSTRADITRLDRIVASFGDMDEAAQDSVIALHGTPLSDYLYMMGLRSGDLRSSADSLAGSAAYSVFLPDVERRFSSEDSLKLSLSTLSKNLNSLDLIDFTPHFYAVISPYRQPIMLVDSLVFIAYNHYLGEDYPGYSSLPRYAAAVKDAGHIPYDVTEALIDSRFPAAETNDLSQRMLREGALTFAVLRSLGETSPARFLGWDDSQYDAAVRGERMAWERLASLNLLYSTDEMDVQKLFAPSPATSVLSPDLPGRMGRYLGYRIVESYVAAHPDADIPFLLSPGFYADPASLINSSYNP